MSRGDAEMSLLEQAPEDLAAFEASVADLARSERYVLRLFVTGMTRRSVSAIASIKAICEKHLRGRYDLEIIDIYQDPAAARDEQIVAAPTLVKKLPLPLRRLIGDLSDGGRVLLGLDLRRERDDEVDEERPRELEIRP
jgi:circadian clock protein KaiB